MQTTSVPQAGDVDRVTATRQDESPSRAMHPTSRFSRLKRPKSPKSGFALCIALNHLDTVCRTDDQFSAYLHANFSEFPVIFSRDLDSGDAYYTVLNKRNREKSCKNLAF